jgi:enoyl-CoA hydratase/carnithine racemase
MTLFTEVRLPEALDPLSAHRLAEALERAGGAAGGGVVLLSGAAPAVFCRGMDFAAAGGPDAGGPTGDGIADFVRCLRAVRFCAKATVALVDGAAIGGGVGLAAACDLVIATERASFALPELLFGLYPAAIWPVLIERLPAQRARLMVLSARAYSAEEARLSGLADLVTPCAGSEETVRRAARALSRAPGRGVARFKRLSAELTALPMDEAMERGAAVTRETLGEASVRAALCAFAAGDAPWAAS